MHLKVSELSYCADGAQLLKKIGLEVRDGEFVGLIGPNRLRQVHAAQEHLPRLPAP